MPATALPFADALAFNCVPESRVPTVTALGVVHVMAGVIGPLTPGVQFGVVDPPFNEPLGPTMNVVQSGKFTRPFTIGYVPPL